MFWADAPAGAAGDRDNKQKSAEAAGAAGKEGGKPEETQRLQVGIHWLERREQRQNIEGA